MKLAMSYFVVSREQLHQIYLGAIFQPLSYIDVSEHPVYGANKIQRIPCIPIYAVFKHHHWHWSKNENKATLLQ